MTKLVKIGTRYVAPPMFEAASLAQTVYLRDLIGDAFRHYIMRYDGVRMDSIRSEEDLVRLKPLMFAYAYSPDFENNIKLCKEKIEIFKRDMTQVDAFAQVYSHAIVPHFVTNTWIEEVDPEKKEQIVSISAQYRTMIDALTEPFFKATEHVPVRPHFIFYSGTYVDGTWEEFLNKNNFEYTEESAQKQTVLKGTVAYKGKVTGPAKVILSPRDFHKLNEGDILVAPMTTPLYVPILHKAAGIVTDEGGVITHDQILIKVYSKSFRKPCLSRVENATRLIVDGDLLYVDAEQGILRIL